MAKDYDHKKLEKKWQAVWEKKGIYHANDFSKKPKFYSLIEFPYPSGAGLHVGHIRSNTAMDIISRKRRMEGYNVLYPIGWDAFGLPTENYAIKTGIQPAVVTKKNTDIFRKQLKNLGFSFDWSREINTTDPKYYKWTQWIFLQMLKKGLAYKAKRMINWCPKDKIGLADEEVVGGCCERCGTIVEKREKEQWMLAITKYAERLEKDLDDVDYSHQIKLGQRNWIGRSEGAEIEFPIFASANFSSLRPSLGASGSKRDPREQKINTSEDGVKVFTTRPDTIFGATYLVLAPDHDLVQKLKPQISNWDEVLRYIVANKKKTEVERTTEDREKTGVELKGIKALNPADKSEIPVWIADYVLATYGTGAIMAVPAHDERDFEFAKKYKLEIKQVIIPVFGEPKADEKERHAVAVFVRRPSDDKYLFINSKTFNRISKVYGGIEQNEKSADAAIREVLEETGYKTRFIRDLGLSTESHFYHPHKKENRRLLCYLVELELSDEKQYAVAEEEKLLHETIWLDYEEAKQKIDNAKELYDFSLYEGKKCFTENGTIINSAKFSGMDSEKAKKEIIKFVGGKEKTTFKLRDWIFSRQRYWGEPIPVINCGTCGLVPVPEKDLPVELPKVKNYQPTESGESPLANISKWVNVKCPKCKGKAKRETDTMPNWAGSSWYYLRYTDPKNKKAFADKKNLKYWTPVDWYNGGMEHTTLHLLYSRFWHKFLFDLKLVPTSEPYKKRTSHGMILGEGGVKMSKSLGNVINPDEIVKIYGADTLRIYEMFIGPFSQSVAWSSESIIGSRRFVEKVWRIGNVVALQTKKNFAGVPQATLGTLTGQNFSLSDAQLKTNSKGGRFQPEAGGMPENLSLVKLLHKTIKKVSEDIESMSFNTAISSMMILATEMEKAERIETGDYKKFLQILAPFAPHVAEELWKKLYPYPTSPYSRGRRKEGVKPISIHVSSWPKWDKDMILDKEVKIVIQINGKVRAEIMITSDMGEEEVKKKMLADKAILKYVEGKDIKRVIYVKNRLINIVLI